MADVIFDIQPANGRLPRDFKKAVAMLFRPYIPVSKKQHDEIEHVTGEAGTDLFRINGSDQIYTFGTADGGFALMPVRMN